MIYHHLRELGYVDSDFNIIDAGRLALLRLRLFCIEPSDINILKIAAFFLFSLN